MNGLKNLIIIAVLAAVGYGVYVSLSRNNVDSDAAGRGRRMADRAEGRAAQPSGIAVAGRAAAVECRLDQAGRHRRSRRWWNGPAVCAALDRRSKRQSTEYRVGHAVGRKPVSIFRRRAAHRAEGAAGPAADAFRGLYVGIVGPAGPPSRRMLRPRRRAIRRPRPGSNLRRRGAVRNLTPPPRTSAADGAPPPAASPSESLIQSEFPAFMAEMQKKLDAGKLAEAHLALSKLYDNPDLPPSMAKQITALLDQLAGTVIYSRQHHLERAYVTQPGETIESIAEKYHVPWQLLAKINGLMPPRASNADRTVADRPLAAGTELKVVRGPFDAVIHLDRRELTLMVGEYYAGRFAIGIGKDQPKLEGEYTVRNKTLNPASYRSDGANIGSNPLGGAWIGLTDRIGIHGTTDPRAIGRDDNPGCDLRRRPTTCKTCTGFCRSDRGWSFCGRRLPRYGLHFLTCASIQATTPSPSTKTNKNITSGPHCTSVGWAKTSKVGFRLMFCTTCRLTAFTPSTPNCASAIAAAVVRWEANRPAAHQQHPRQPGGGGGDQSQRPRAATGTWPSAIPSARCRRRTTPRPPRPRPCRACTASARIPTPNACTLRRQLCAASHSVSTSTHTAVVPNARPNINSQRGQRVASPTFSAVPSAAPDSLWASQSSGQRAT